MNATTNGRARKSLADQIDRLDHVLDGLAEGLNDAVAQAVKEAVRTVLGEVLAYPEIGARLRARQAEPTPKKGIVATARRVWMWLRAKGRQIQQVGLACAKPLVRAAETAQIKACRMGAGIWARLLGGLHQGLARMCRLRGLATSRIAVLGFGFGVGLVVGSFVPGWWALLTTILVGMGSNWHGTF